MYTITQYYYTQEIVNCHCNHTVIHCIIYDNNQIQDIMYQVIQN